jgi:hypothetical protein
MERVAAQPDGGDHHDARPPLDNQTIAALV